MKITLFTDGSCLKPGGPGGYAALAFEGLLDPYCYVTESQAIDRAVGNDSATTNQRMEVVAVLQGLAMAKRLGANQVRVVSDSQYALNGAREWLPNWKQRGWKTYDGKPVKNKDLWEAIDVLISLDWESLDFVHVRGHRGVPGNEAVDLLAGEQMRQALYQLN